MHCMASNPSNSNFIDFYVRYLCAYAISICKIFVVARIIATHITLTYLMIHLYSFRKNEEQQCWNYQSHDNIFPLYAL